MPDQGRQRGLRKTKGHCYANQVVMWIHANYPVSHARSRSAKRAQGPKGIYANQSRDVDSRKLILAVMLDQGLAKKTQVDKGIVCKLDGYTRKPNPKLGGIAGGNGRKKETARKRIKELGHGYRQSSSGAYQVAPACVPHTSPPRWSNPSPRPPRVTPSPTS
jgi:hypothetical protein